MGAAAIAIMAKSAFKLVRTTVGNDYLLWSLLIALALTTAWTQTEIVWLFVVCGVVSMLIKAPPRRHNVSSTTVLFSQVGVLFTGLHGLASASTISVLFQFFVKAGAFVFGSGLAIVPFLYG